MSFSNTLNFMLKSGEGYRNIGFSSGITELNKIIDFEIHELDNEDIIDFMKNNYKDYNIDSFMLKNEIINYTLSFIAKLLNTYKENLRGVWLTTYQDVLDIYCDKKYSKNINILKVYIHENKMIPISDLDNDGALFVYVDDINIERVEYVNEGKNLSNMELEQI